MATAGLGARVAALEVALGATNEARRSGVVVLLPGESVDEAMARVGPGSWLVVPGVSKSSEAWSQAVRNGSGEVRGV